MIPHILSPVGVLEALKQITDKYKEDLGITEASTELVRQQDRTRNTANDTFTFHVSRDFEEDTIEVICEITHVEPPGQGGCWDEQLSGHVTLGDCWTLDGKSFELTPLECETAERQCWEEITEKGEVAHQDLLEQKAVELMEDEE